MWSPDDEVTYSHSSVGVVLCALDVMSSGVVGVQYTAYVGQVGHDRDVTTSGVSVVQVGHDGHVTTSGVSVAQVGHEGHVTLLVFLWCKSGMTDIQHM